MEAIIKNRFRIVKLLGRGGTGDVFLAEDSKHGRQVAIKRIGADFILDLEEGSHFRHGAQAASQLNHPNVCAIYEIIEEQDREFIIMQYVDGVTLAKLMKIKPLTLDQVIDIALQIAAGLQAAQDRNIVHRDIKPGNIMIDCSGKVKILDFGLAKICPVAVATENKVCTDPELADKGIIMGTASYMSPEQVKGLHTDGRTDIFSYGVVLYEMIENKNPFSARENIVTLYNILHSKIRFSRDVPKLLRAIVKKAVRKNRRYRYKDFSEIIKDLLVLQKQLAQGANRTP
ncbi:MAG: serine/threonine-protein kinase [Chrysiogenia bacterium]